MQSRSGSHYLYYSTAVIAPIIIGVFMAASWPLLVENQVAVFLLAVIVSAWLGGLYPGLLSLVISLIISDYFFIEPYNSFEIPGQANVLRILVTVLVGTFISFGCESLRRERRTAQAGAAAVANSEARLSGIIGSAMDAIITLDSQQKIVVFNNAAEMMFKCPAAEAFGQSVERFIPKRFRASHGDHVRKFGETKVTTRSMRSLGGIFGIRSDGEEFPIEASISQLEANGEKFYTVILRDITERELAVEEVRAHKDRLAAVIENEPECVKVVDSNGRLTEMNPAGLAMLEVDTLEQAQGMTLKAFILPEYRDAFADLHRQVIAGGTGKLEFEVLGAKGGRRWLDTHAVPLRDSEGKIRSLLGITRDITERKRSEAKSIENEAKLAAAQRHARVGSWELDLATRTGEWSAEMFRLFDRDPEAGVPDFEEFMQLAHPDDHAIMREAEARAMRELGPVGCEYRSNPARGPLKYFDVTIHMVRDGEGKIAHMAGTVQDITERKKAEEEARELADRQIAILNALPAHIALIDAQGVILSVNEAWRRFAAANVLQSEDFSIGQNYLSVCEEATGDCSIEAKDVALGIREVLAGRKTEFAIEYPCHSPEEERWFRLMVTPLHEDRRQGAVVMHLDISERRRAEESVRASDLRYRRLFESTKDGILIVDAETGMVTDVNPFLIELLGFSHEEFLGKKIWELGFFKDIIANQDHFAELQQKEYIRYEDMALETYSGRRIEVEFTSNLYMVDHHKVIQCDIRDITDRKQAEAERARLLHVLEASLNEIYIFDAQTLRFQYVNDGARRNLGYSMEAMRSLTPVDLKPEFSTATFNETIGSLLRHEKEKLIFQTVHSRADGSLYPVEVHLQLVERDGDAVFLAVINDITERKGAEEQVRKLNADLEQRVVDRTEQLEAANKELESFSYSVSHDLRSPLRHIDGFVQLLTKREADRLDDTSGRYLRIVSDAVLKMGTLIDELLAFSRTSRVEIKTARVDLNTLIALAKTELAPAMTGRRIKWKVSDLPPVKGDRVLLGIVMTNLLSNAIKYTRDCDEAHIEVGSSGETESEVTIFVKDDGAGFDMKYADKLFGVFQRLHREDEFEGIGIGLATVQRIIHRHDGKIWPESELDKGTTFFMTLKKAKAKGKTK